jgi:hypothetical protein
LKNWDPIGVADIAEAKDEYRGYCRGVYDAAVRTRSAHAIAEHLFHIARDRMGLSPRSPKQMLPVGQKILDLVAEVGPLP